MSFDELKTKWSGSSGEEKSGRRYACMAAGVLVVLLLVLGGVIFSQARITQDVSELEIKEPVYVRIMPGMGTGEIADALLEEGVISSRNKFLLAAKVNGADSRFQVGVFALEQDMPVRDALNILVNGHSVAVRVTVPEGLNVREVAKIFAQSGLVDEQEFLAEARTFAPYDYIESVPEADYRIEGFLFPDTYDFATDATPRDIMQKMTDEFDSRLTADMREQAAAKNMSIYQLVTMASLVEKEARYAEDRPIIAQVFLTRLAINMPLQTDTTLQYLLDEVKEDLTIADTRMESPYNTYLHFGLPPGPIASPGLASLEAVLASADTDYLYFVADRQGHNYYSHTYDEHLSKVDQVR